MPKSQDRVPSDDAIVVIGQAQAEGFGLLTILGVEGAGQGEEAEFAQVAPGQNPFDVIVAEHWDRFVTHSDSAVPRSRIVPGPVAQPRDRTKVNPLAEEANRQ